MAKIHAIKSLIAELNNHYSQSNNKISNTKDVQQVIEVTTPEAKEKSTQLYEKLNACLSQLIEGVDYMRLPKVETPILLKNGSIKILKALNLSYNVSLVNQIAIPSEKFLSYVSQVSLIDEQGKVVVSSLGAANSHEAKFSKQGLSCDPLIINMAVKRALVSATKFLILIYKGH